MTVTVHIFPVFLEVSWRMDEESIVAPPFSLISEVSLGEVSSLDDDLVGEVCNLDDDLVELGFKEGTAMEESQGGNSEATEVPTSGNHGIMCHWEGYILVGDNIDKNIRPSFQRIDKTTRSLHHFHVYAVLDRVDFSGLSDTTPTTTVVDPLSLLPSNNDIARLKQEMSILISR